MAECPPDTSNREISADLAEKSGKEKKGKWRRKEGKSKKGKVENWKWKEEKWQNEEMTLLCFVCFFFFVCVFLFFVFLLFTFQNHWNLFWVYQNGNFLLGKSISCQEKIQEKLLCSSLKNFPLMPCIKHLGGPIFKLHLQVPLHLACKLFQLRQSVKRNCFDPMFILSELWYHFGDVWHARRDKTMSSFHAHAEFHALLVELTLYMSSFTPSVSSLQRYLSSFALCASSFTRYMSNYVTFLISCRK